MSENLVAPRRATSWPRAAPFTDEQPVAPPAGRVPLTPYVRALAAAADVPLTVLSRDPRRGRPTPGSVESAVKAERSQSPGSEVERPNPASSATLTRCLVEVPLPGNDAVIEVGLARLVVAAVGATRTTPGWAHGSDVLVHRRDGRSTLLAPAADLGEDGVLRALSASDDRGATYADLVGLAVYDLSGCGLDEAEVSPVLPVRATLTIASVRARPVAVELPDGEPALRVARRARLVLVATGVDPVVVAGLLERISTLLGGARG